MFCRAHLSELTFGEKSNFKRISANSNFNTSPKSNPNPNPNPNPKAQKPFRENEMTSFLG